MERADLRLPLYRADGVTAGVDVAQGERNAATDIGDHFVDHVDGYGVMVEGVVTGADESGQCAVEFEDESLEDDADCAVIVPDCGHGDSSVGDQGLALLRVDDEGEPVVGDVVAPLSELEVEQFAGLDPAGEFRRVVCFHGRWCR